MHWFDLFRADGAPTYFYRNISQPLDINIRTFITFLLFLVPWLSFVIIIPGLREKKLSSFFTLTYHMGIGTLLIASLVLPYWNVGSARIVSQFTPDNVLHEADLGVSVGLTGINVSLSYIKTLDAKNPEKFKGMYFNEKYMMDGVDAMEEELHKAYDEGMPYPFLKVLEYFSLNNGLFNWGRCYRKAGYYANAMLYTAVSTWILQSVLLLLLPHQYGKVGLFTGCFALIGVLIYAFIGPTSLEIPFMGIDGNKTYLKMKYGTCFYLAIVAGILSVFVSFILCVLQYFRIYSLDTIFSSNLDSTVGPKCKYGPKQFDDEQYISSSCSNPSTIFTQINSTPIVPSYNSLNISAAKYNPFDETTVVINIPEDGSKPTITHKKRNSNDSNDTATSQSTAFTTDLKSCDSNEPKCLESRDRIDSIGNVSHLGDDDSSFTRRNFTLPLKK
uniref:Uncharacterized protein n=1 Tax=Panagrolaimus sp. JU765 TaxID=591449 RepID=A0AC34PW44_9BILA